MGGHPDLSRVAPGPSFCCLELVRVKGLFSPRRTRFGGEMWCESRDCSAPDVQCFGGEMWCDSRDCSARDTRVLLWFRLIVFSRLADRLQKSILRMQCSTKRSFQIERRSPSDRLHFIQFIVCVTSVVMFQWNLPCALFSFRRLLRSTLLPSGSR